MDIIRFFIYTEFYLSDYLFIGVFIYTELYLSDYIFIRVFIYTDIFYFLRPGFGAIHLGINRDVFGH